MTEPPNLLDMLGASPVVEDLRLFVPGDPAPQGSKRAFRNPKSGRIQLTESSKTVGPWRERVALAAHMAMSGRNHFDGAVSVCLNFVLPRPKSAPKRSTPKATKRPDLDKLERAVLDALTGVCFADDSQVVSLSGYKRIAEIGETAGVEIRIEEELS